MNNAPLDDTTRTISWVSYLLLLVVAVSAVVPGAQMGPLLLIVAWVAISIWFLYRIVLGMVRLNAQRPMGD